MNNIRICYKDVVLSYIDIQVMQYFKRLDRIAERHHPKPTRQIFDFRMNLWSCC